MRSRSVPASFSVLNGSSDPGVLFLLQNSTSVIIPPTVVFVILTWQNYLPTSLVWALTLAAAPFFIAARIHQRYRSIHHALSRSGATLPPRWDGKLPGHFDVMQEMVDSLNQGYPGDFAWPRFMRHGSVVQTNILWDMMYITCDPDVMKTVLATDFDSYVKGSSSLWYVIVITSTHALFRFHRSMTRPFFSKDRISHFDIFDRHAELAISKMNQRFDAGTAVDFQDLVSRFTLDAASEFLFGSCVRSLQSPLPTLASVAIGPPNHASARATIAQRFATAFQEAEHVCSERAWRGWIWPLFEAFENKSTKHMQVVDQFLEPIVQDALRKRDMKSSEGEESANVDDEETFLDHLVRYTSVLISVLFPDPVVLHDEVLNILLAGRDTTASTLTFAVYLLCEHPAALARLRSEILAKVGRLGRPTYEDIKEMKYLRAVINETLRLFPAVYAVKETFLPNPDPKGKPFYVAPGTPVSYYPFVMHRNTEYWGPDAMEFDPDRFLDERLHKYLVPNPFIFLPFNAGPRICLGQQFAYNEISFFLIKLLQRFDTMRLDLRSQPPGSLPPEAWSDAWGRKAIEKIWPKVHLTLYVNGGLWVKMKEAAD
ncbi:cytochrome P450 [Fomitopsis serialis]|uniref:cytochrome P450 n=1 Tax=Fomitopsis serialis TaxID=139415 RepID=UPI002008AEE9|nr:cytochrome P450 [Neoantrodia serialis]KAH9918439.1 cytochrome P450 [Neoantrodia serialis]